MADNRGNPNWKKGTSGNPNGRPKKGKTLSDILEAHLKTKDIEIENDETGETTKISRKNALVEKIIILALNGDLSAIKYIWDRIDGPITQDIDLNHSGSVVIVDNIPDDE